MQKRCVSANTVPDSRDVIPCLRCGVCCTRWQPQLELEEVGHIARHLGLSTEDFKRAYLVERAERFGLLLLVQEQGHCIFLRYRGNEAECAINAFKPIACQKWTPSLSRPECQEGLKKYKTSGLLILPGEIYASQEDLTTFYRSLEASRTCWGTPEPMSTGNTAKHPDCKSNERGASQRKPAC